MKHGSLRRSLMLSAAVIGCQGCGDTNQQVKSAPGGLPTGQLSRADRTHEIHATTFFAHGHLLERQGAFDRAVAQYQDALKAKPDFLICLNRLGITLNKLGRHAEATESFRKAILLRGTLAHLHNNLGFSLYLEAKYEEAERSLARAIELKPEFGRARMNHAVTLAKLGQYNEAFAEMRTTAGAADAAFNMGMLLTEAGRYADAAKYLEAALAAKPNFEAARTQLNELSKLAAAEDAEVQAARAIDSLRVGSPTADTTAHTTTSDSTTDTATAIADAGDAMALTTDDSARSSELSETTAVESTIAAEPSEAHETTIAPDATMETTAETGLDTSTISDAGATFWTTESTTESTIEADATDATDVTDTTIRTETADQSTFTIEAAGPAVVMHTGSTFDIWTRTELAGDVGFVAGTTVEAPTTGWADDETITDDPNCTTATSPIEPITIPAIRPEVVSSLIEDFTVSMKWHRDLAAEVLCRLEIYMQTGELWSVENDATE